MKYLGKLLGGIIGFIYGGPVGLIIGVIVGHLFDRTRARASWPGAGHAHEIQATFFSTTFSVMGYVCKVDGRVTEQEIEAARRIMDRMGLSPDKRREAIDCFNHGKRDDFDLDAALARFRRVCRGQVNLFRVFLEIQLQAAFADGKLGSAERRALMQIARGLGLSEQDFAHLEALLQNGFYAGGFQSGARAAAPPDRLAKAYRVLGIPVGAPDGEVKRAYRRLISQHHPDKLVSRGLPEEMMKLAEEKSREITAAYDTIKEARGMH